MAATDASPPQDTGSRPDAHPIPLRQRLLEGMVIPAHPLALNRRRRLDERRQRALTRYYLAAGAGGLAVGVHTTQFAIRDPRHGLLQPVLELAAETASEAAGPDGTPRTPRTPRTPPVLIAGLCGPTAQAAGEAELARSLGYHAGLLSLGALRDATETELLSHCRSLARLIPLVGFYLQPGVGGRLLSGRFWRRFAGLPEVVAIKVAPFNRYQTLDVVRAVAEAGRARDIALYTGNDDHIVHDLLARYEIPTATQGRPSLGFVGGLLGQWACGTRRAVSLLDRCRAARAEDSIPADLLVTAEHLTDTNAALFDAAHGFAGCIAGIHEVLRRQGLLEHLTCLDPHEGLSPGQAAEITRVLRSYPHLSDADFIRRHLDTWLN